MLPIAWAKQLGVKAVTRGILIAVLIIVILGVVAATTSYFQGAGVNRDNPIVEDQEGNQD